MVNTLSWSCIFENNQVLTSCKQTDKTSSSILLSILGFLPFDNLLNCKLFNHHVYSTIDQSQLQIDLLIDTAKRIIANFPTCEQRVFGYLDMKSVYSPECFSLAKEEAQKCDNKDEQVELWLAIANDEAPYDLLGAIWTLGQVKKLKDRQEGFPALIRSLLKHAADANSDSFEQAHFLIRSISELSLLSLANKTFLYHFSLKSGRPINHPYLQLTPEDEVSLLIKLGQRFHQVPLLELAEISLQIGSHSHLWCDWVIAMSEYDWFRALDRLDQIELPNYKFDALKILLIKRPTIASFHYLNQLVHSLPLRYQVSFWLCAAELAPEDLRPPLFSAAREGIHNLGNPLLKVLGATELFEQTTLQEDRYLLKDLLDEIPNPTTKILRLIALAKMDPSFHREILPHVAEIENTYDAIDTFIQVIEYYQSKYSNALNGSLE